MDPIANPACNILNVTASGLFYYNMVTGLWSFAEAAPNISVNCDLTFSTVKDGTGRCYTEYTDPINRTFQDIVGKWKWELSLEARLSCNLLSIYLNWSINRQLCYPSAVPQFCTWFGGGGNVATLLYQRIENGDCSLNGKYVLTDIPSLASKIVTGYDPSTRPVDPACSACDAYVGIGAGFPCNGTGSLSQSDVERCKQLIFDACAIPREINVI